MGNFQGGGGGFKGGFGGKPGFQKKSFGGGRPSFGGGDRGGDRRGGDMQMHKAICSNCNKSCEVPFRPTGEKPIYCKDCFGAKREGGDRAPRRDFDNRMAPREDRGDRGGRDFAKPSFLPDKRGAGVSAYSSADDSKKELRDISMKLDRLINAVEKMNSMNRGSKPEQAAEGKYVTVSAPKAEFKQEAKREVRPEVKKAPVVAKAAPKKAVTVKAPAKKIEKKADKKAMPAGRQVAVKKKK